MNKSLKAEKIKNESKQSHSNFTPQLPFVYILLMFVFIIATAVFYKQYFLPFHKMNTVLPEITPIPTEEVKQNTLFQPSFELSTAHNQLGFELLSILSKENDSKNVFISPSSITMALSMVLNGADNQTKEAMAKTLHVENIPLLNLNTQNLDLVTRLKSADPDVEIKIANSIWPRIDLTFSPEFINTNKTYYEAEIKHLDFSLPSAANTINSWVNENTNGKIPEIISPPIDKDVVMYLINAIYFHGTWTYAFNPELTQEKAFTLSDSSQKSLPFMKQRRTDYRYLENEDFQAAILPYGKEKKLNMYVFLPKNDLSQFLEKLNMNNWNTWLAGFKETEGTLLLPKFQLDFEKELKDTLVNLGMDIAFSNNADFSKIRSEKDVKISKVKHKTFLSVDEEGTEAAAATSVEMMFTTAIGDQNAVFYMDVNKPFFLAIIDNESREILFLGAITNP